MAIIGQLGLRTVQFCGYRKKFIVEMGSTLLRGSSAVHSRNELPVTSDFGAIS